MHIVFLQLFEQYQAGRSYTVERTLGIGLCKRGIAVPFTVHQEMLRDAKAKKDEDEAKAAKEKIESDKRDAGKKAELLKRKETEKKEQAVSKQAEKMEKAVKR